MLPVGDGEFKDDVGIVQQIRRGERRRRCVRVVEFDRRSGDLRPRVGERLILGIDSGALQRIGVHLLHLAVCAGVGDGCVVLGANRDGDGIGRRVLPVGDGEFKGDVGIVQQIRRGERRRRGVRIVEFDRRTGDLRPRVGERLILRIDARTLQGVGVCFLHFAVCAGVGGGRIIFCANRDRHGVERRVDAIGNRQLEDDVAVTDEVRCGE